MNAIEYRLNKLGYRLSERVYDWSQYKVIVGPSDPMFIRFFDTIDSIENWIVQQENS